MLNKVTDRPLDAYQAMTLPEFIYALREQQGLANRAFANQAQISLGRSYDMQASRMHKRMPDADGFTYTPISFSFIESLAGVRHALGLDDIDNESLRPLRQCFTKHAWEYVQAIEAAEPFQKRADKSGQRAASIQQGKVMVRSWADQENMMLDEAPDVGAYMERYFPNNAIEREDKKERRVIARNKTHPSLSTQNLGFGQFLLAMTRAVPDGRILGVFKEQKGMAYEMFQLYDLYNGHSDEQRAALGSNECLTNQNSHCVFGVRHLQRFFDYLCERDPQSEVFTPYQKARFWCLAEDYADTTKNLYAENRKNVTDDMRQEIEDALDQTIPAGMACLCDGADAKRLDIYEQVAELYDNDQLRDMVTAERAKGTVTVSTLVDTSSAAVVEPGSAKYSQIGIG